MRKLIINTAIWLGIEAVTLFALDIVGASQSWREAIMFWAGALTGLIIELRGEEPNDPH